MQSSKNHSDGAERLPLNEQKILYYIPFSYPGGIKTVRIIVVKICVRILFIVSIVVSAATSQHEEVVEVEGTCHKSESRNHQNGRRNEAGGVDVGV